MHEIGNPDSQYAAVLSTYRHSSDNISIIWRAPVEEAKKYASEAEHGAREAVVVYADNDHKLSEEEKQKVLRLTGVKLQGIFFQL